MYYKELTPNQQTSDVSPTRSDYFEQKIKYDRK